MNITSKDIGLATAFILAGFAFGFPLGTSLERTHWRQDAIEAGVGRFLINEKTGVADFVFNTPEKVDGPEIYQQKAIKAGAAHWTIDALTGEKSFRFFAQQQQQVTPVVPATHEKLKVAPQLEKKDAGAAGISVTVPQ